MRLSQWPPAERPREKLLAKGAASLSDAELLAIFLRTGCRGFDSMEIRPPGLVVSLKESNWRFG